MEKERAVLYARISLDKTGDEVGVQRQLRDMQALAQVRGYDVVDEIAENNITASKDLYRPGYEKVWGLVRSGQVDHVIVWQTSRFVRSRKERAEVIEQFGKHNVDVVAVKGPSLDLRTAYGRGLADVMTAFDSMEGEVKAERVSAAITDLARQGKGWGFTPYGWDVENGVRVVNQHEAGVVVELVDRVLAGESLHEIHRDLTARGEPSPGYALWMKLPEAEREKRLVTKRLKRKPTPLWPRSAIRTLISRDANIGIRRYSANGTEMEAVGDWPPIVERAKHDRLRALLSDPRRRSHTGPRPGGRKHLLTSGIGRCGVCGSDLRVSVRRNRRGQNEHYYSCSARGGCTARKQDFVDEMVTRTLIHRMSRPDALDWLTIGDDEAAQKLADRIAELQGRLDDVADSFARGAITARQMERITGQLTPDLAEAQRERSATARAVDRELLAPLAGEKAETRWRALAVSRQRAVLESLGVAVVLKRRNKPGPGVEPESIEITWGGTS
ncbi:recombinase [Mycobacteroides abscessus subsp. bolletii 1S-154-0310]|uniref:recombinase family protein n=1 Tax=Mycobacteroides abscessus TaxID=36809 RepID=UPI000268288C|nr:recombinase family protein [Mycobacteroides abscessus]EIU63249.1 recombinase [Mycobacteroides abscessus subsp. bolletii 1S-151-0930]EIU70620.1 recombinase [Mycobacteroides abscessus subsp. bolletii 1S-152-0914]EIU73829.1 recombinase [Mycobacteroides abscessus subsp. bolletii 1S-153-0915]EIU80911.1 recombinase [Mycobacteroides abscessus subsp. bolletii 1S-154-0310]MBE5481563.1 hypothetical protein [Mycobacteroides abscessus]